MNPRATLTLPGPTGLAQLTASLRCVSCFHEAFDQRVSPHTTEQWASFLYHGMSLCEHHMRIALLSEQDGGPF